MLSRLVPRSEFMQWLLLTGCFGGIALVLYVLPLPLPAANKADPTWQTAITEAFLSRSQFGRDLIFTYGPWGFVSDARGNPAIYPWVFWSRLLLAISLAAGAALVAVRRIPNWMGRWAWMAAVMLLSQPMYILPVLLFVVVEHLDDEAGRLGTSITVLLAVACSLAMWVKFTQLILIGSLCLVLLVIGILRRRLPVVPLILAVGGITFWMLAHQPLSNLPEYIRTGIAVAKGYSAAMSGTGPMWEPMWAAMIATSMVLAYCGFVFEKRQWRLAPGLAWVMLFFFLVFKQAFTRGDGEHLRMGIVEAFLPGSLILAAALGVFDMASFPRFRYRIVRVLAFGAAVLVASAIIPFSSLAFERFGLQYQSAMVRRNLSSVWAMVRGKGKAFEEAEERAFRREHPLRPVSGPADFFPDDAGLLYGNGMKARLRPVPQAYSVYSESLARINAGFLRGKDRPEFVIFDVGAIDERYPTAADPLSWLALLDCYEPAGLTGSYLLLHGVPCVESRRELIAQRTARPGEYIALPADERSPVWVEAELSPNWQYALISSLFRAPRVFVHVDVGGQQREFRLIPDLVGTGLLLSPFLSNPAQFGLLYSDGQVEPKTAVRGFSLEVTRRQFFAPSMQVRLYRLKMPRRTAAPLASAAEIRFAGNVHGESEMDNQIPPPSWRIDQGQLGIEVNARSAGEIELGAGSRTLDLGFGLKNSCTDKTGVRSRVRFRAFWLTTGVNSPAVLLDRVLESDGDQRVEDKITIPLHGSAGRLTLRTDPEGGNCMVGAWWSEINAY